jgi:hypothetical protein
MALQTTFVGLLLAAPGNGHSILWLTQLPCMLIVSRLAPHAGSCFSCATQAWAIGIALQATALFLFGLLSPRVAVSES